MNFDADHFLMAFALAAIFFIVLLIVQCNANLQAEKTVRECLKKNNVEECRGLK